MREAHFSKYSLEFKRPAGTSRGILNTKDTWFLVVREDQKVGIGECGMFRGLSIDDRPDFEDKLQWLCDNINNDPDLLYDQLNEFPAIQIGLETALRSLEASVPSAIFPSEFQTGESDIPINGLIWMGDFEFMHDQIEQKLEEGFDCIKLKIGAIDFRKELELLEEIRKRFSVEKIELRVDANGAFNPSEALEKLNQLAQYELHSIEQPIKQGQWKEMAALCEQTPLPIALDEELIGVFSIIQKEKLLDTIKPQYIILKPTLVGGFKGCDEWISLVEDRDIGWWITSALESNIGLNAISQYTFTKNSKLPQGLGTGGLFTNNITSPLSVEQGKLLINNELQWDYQSLKINT